MKRIISLFVVTVMMLALFCTTIVGAAEVVSIALPETAEVAVLGTTTLSAAIAPEDATAALSWSSSDATIATVDENGVVKGIKQGSAVVTATATDGSEVSASCTVIVKGGMTYLNDFENAETKTFVNGNTWKKVQEEDGNWVLDFDAATYTNTTGVAGAGLTNISSGAGVIPIPGADGGFVLDFDLKRVSPIGHKMLSMRIGSDANVNHWPKIDLTKLETNQWYDMKIHIVTGKSTTLYWKKASDSAWVKTTGSPLGSQSPITGTIAPNNVTFYPYVASTSSDDMTLATAQKTHFRIDNIKVSSPVTAAGFALSEESGSIDISTTKSIQLTPVFSPSNATDTNVHYASSNPAVATVDRLGKITATGLGDVVITATSADGQFTDTYSLNVYASVKAEGIEISGDSEMIVGEEKTLTATASPEGAADLVTWSSADETLATVSDKGVVTAHKHGDVTITATAIDGSGVTAEHNIKIDYISSERTFNKSSLVLDLFESEQLVLNFNPANASYQEITWSSADTSVATVDSTGLVKTMGQGETIISATTAEGTVYCTVTVKGGVTYLNDFEDETNTKFTNSLWTKVQEEDGNWVLDFNAATYTAANGIAAGNLGGTSNVVGAIPVPNMAGGIVLDFDVKRVSAEGHKAINLRIGAGTTPDQYARVNISMFDVNEWYDVKLYIQTGKTTTLYWKKAYASEWNIAVPYNNPFLYGPSISTSGTKDNLAFYPYIVDSKTDDMTLATARKTHFQIDNIKISAPVSATGMNLEKNSVLMNVGATTTINPVFTPSNATDTNVCYTSSNTAVATVDRKGKVTAIGAGSATITAIAADGGYSASYEVTVKDVLNGAAEVTFLGAQEKNEGTYSIGFGLNAELLLSDASALTMVMGDKAYTTDLIGENSIINWLGGRIYTEGEKTMFAIQIDNIGAEYMTEADGQMVPKFKLYFK